MIQFHTDKTIHIIMNKFKNTREIVGQKKREQNQNATCSFKRTWMKLHTRLENSH
jgi:hypothetical protein